ncbi:nitroreductase/quinone reductase family protein [Nocardia stercoris]|uniref:Nitroreductase family deazaflavin-dependent oxidoreductase n=1 Tax=Nocardia stercoris TaxID=2483361 RepID=A0A3M2L305_9NOCA|nr:nitroreductase/quinone reductase family protein [Nocardia stercoris]RMI32099.1 nitroreductase family deazaflavin-dependent oxidoreductase [Nocardia stercoris]
MSAAPSPAADLRRRITVLLQRYVVNPVGRRLAPYLPNEAVLETVGRKSGLPRPTPIGGQLDGATFMFVSEFGRKSQYVRNLEVNPRVRLQIKGQWYPGTATVLDGDDAHERVRRLPKPNSLLVRLIGTDLLTIRIDLDSAP